MSNQTEFDTLGADLLKAFGNGLATRNQNVRYFSTGFAPLNKIISGRHDRGIPSGRIVEIFGPSQSGKTHIATEIMISAQQQGGAAIFVDFERRFVPEFAQRRGLNVAAPFFLYQSPKTWEQGNANALAIAERIRESKAFAPDAPIVCVVDSIASANPASKITGTKDKDGDFSRGKQLEFGMNDTTALARATSQTLPVVAQFCDDLNMTMIYLNQVRTKPGVCLRYDAFVTLANGNQVKIGKLVHAREPVEVLTVDPSTGEVLTAKIAQFHRNSYDGDWVQVVSAGGKNGRRSAFFTPEHEILTLNGWRRADSLTVGEDVNTVDLRHYTDDQHRLVLGSLLGDGQLRFGDGKSPTAEKSRLRMTHGHKQFGYIAWKAKLLGLEPRYASRHCWADTNSTHEFGYLREVNKFKALYGLPQTIIDRIDEFVFAIWFMDDGGYSRRSGGIKYGEGRYTITAKKLPLNVLEAVANKAVSLGMGMPRIKVGTGLIWSGIDAKAFGESIAPYVPSCMSYKLNRKLTAGGDSLTLDRMEPKLVTYTNKVLSVTRRQNRGCQKDRYKYDIGIENTHSFVAGGGIVVHNSYGDPTTRPGGASIDFYADVRIQLGKKLESEGKGKDRVVLGQEITAKALKACTAPFKECSWILTFQEDGDTVFDREASLVEHLVDNKLITAPAQGWLEFNGQKYRKGALIEAIRKDPAGYDAMCSMLVD